MEISSELTNIPGIGPARRAALKAAGITTRDALAQASVEQVISVTGMSRVQAERALAFLHTDSAPVAPPPLAAGDETQATPEGDLPPVEASEPSAPEPEPPAELERALLAAQTALADASRVLGTLPTLNKPLARLVVLLDRIGARSGQMGPKRKGRIAERLLRLTRRLEKAASQAGTKKATPAKRLAERFKKERALLAELIATKPRRKS